MGRTWTRGPQPVELPVHAGILGPNIPKWRCPLCAKYMEIGPLKDHLFVTHGIPWDVSPGPKKGSKHR